MRVAMITMILGSAISSNGSHCLAQAPGGQRGVTSLRARIEVDTREHSFTVRLFLKNDGEKEEKVVYGRGGSGLEVVPRIDVAGISITPPTYLRPPRRAMAPNMMAIPAGKEVLYGSFTMGYPPVRRAGEEKLIAFLHFRELNATLETEPQMLKIPDAKPAK